MEFKLLTITVLLNVVFVISDTIPFKHQIHNSNTVVINQDEIGLHSSIEASIEEKKEKPFEKNVPDNEVDPTTTEDLEINNVTTTTENPHNVETTTGNSPDSQNETTDHGVRKCSKELSSYTKQDLISIINYISEKELNVMVVLSDSYYNTAIYARNKLLKELRDFKNYFENRPEHLYHILEDMKDTREKKIVPLVETAVATIFEFPAVKEDYIKLYNRTMEMLGDLENYKIICKYNCHNRQLMRSSFPLRAITVVPEDVVIPEDKNYLCSTMEKIHATVNERLSTFVQEVIEKTKQYITDRVEYFNVRIETLKISLKKEAVSQFGMTMLEILNLYDDQFHFTKTLEEFNKHSYTSMIRKTNMNIEYKLLSLDTKIRNYRQQCLSCGQVKPQRRFALDTMDEIIETAEDTNETDILDSLISDKLNEIENVVHTAIEHIFKELNETLNDNEYVEKNVDNLKPIQDSIGERTEQEKQALEKLMNSASKHLRESVKYLSITSSNLMKTINEAFNFFRDLHLN